MNIIDQMNEHLGLIKRVEQVKKEIHNLSINWETDITKMDFSKLESGNPFGDNDKLRVDHITDNPVPVEDLFEDKFTAIRMFDFIEIVKTGEKIIPPITRVDYVFVNGRIEKKLSFICNKGRRMLLARFLNHHSIPTIIWERISEYTFNPEKYLFECVDDFLITTSKSDGKKYHIDLKIYHPINESVNHLKLSAL